MTEPKYYKVIGADNKSVHGGDFDWTEYLPKGDEPGKWTPEIREVVPCQSGYHVTEFWNMWYGENYRVFECEVRGEGKSDDSVGVMDKMTFSSIRLLRQCHLVFENDHNTGDMNTGDMNTGYKNTGDSNTGHMNTGACNTGDKNTGHKNTGDRNTGHRNTGNRNAGDRNTGNWNKADWCTGHLNSITADDFTVFNKPCLRSTWEAAKVPDFMYFNLYGSYLESWRRAYDEASDEDKLLLIKLPNFDADVFYEISGIKVDPKTGQEVKG